MTPLHAAAMTGKKAAVELLLKNKADIGLKSVATLGDKDSFTALGWAERWGEKEIAEVLRKCGAKE